MRSAICRLFRFRRQHSCPIRKPFILSFGFDHVAVHFRYVFFRLYRIVWGDGVFVHFGSCAMVMVVARRPVRRSVEGLGWEKEGRSWSWIGNFLVFVGRYLNCVFVFDTLIGVLVQDLKKNINGYIDMR